MKNTNQLPLTYHLLPTGELSKKDELCNTAYGIAISGKDGIGMGHHLYLASNRDIKEDEWAYNHYANLIQKMDEFAMEDYKKDKDKFSKIEFTTDPKLWDIKQIDGVNYGVPAIDANTKARVEFIGLTKELNFLEVFVEKYQKDNQKGVDKIGLKKLFEEYSDVWDERDKKIAESGYNQALKSNTGRFSLEDMKDAFDKGAESGSRNWDSYLRPNIEAEKKEFIQSLTKEKPKGDIVIECEMETVRHSCSGSEAIFTFEIKLKDGQPIIHFK